MNIILRDIEVNGGVVCGVLGGKLHSDVEVEEAVVERARKNPLNKYYIFKLVAVAETEQAPVTVTPISCVKLHND